MVSQVRWCRLTTPSLALSQEDAQLYRCNLCGPAAAGEIPSSEQEAYMAFVDLEFKHLTMSLRSLSDGP